MQSDARHIVIFDGMCNLCAHSVAFILAHERDDVIQFAATQSAAGQELLRTHRVDPQDVGTVVYIKGDTVYVRSDAALEIARHLRPPWKMLRIFRHGYPEAA